MKTTSKRNIVYEDGKPVYHGGQFQNLKKCPNCKSTEIKIGNRVERVKTLKDGKVVNTWIAENDYSFSCVDCGMVIEIDGHIEFERRYDNQ
jgi:hypothetical protein